MNILVVNWTWYPSGGDWTYVESVVDLYTKNGHTVIPFSMKDERNFPTYYSKYFIENIEKTPSVQRAFLMAASMRSFRGFLFSLNENP